MEEFKYSICVYHCSAKDIRSLLHLDHKQESKYQSQKQLPAWMKDYFFFSFTKSHANGADTNVQSKHMDFI